MEEKHPISDLPDVIDVVHLLKTDAFSELPRPWPRGQDIQASAFKVAMKDDLVLAVSHAWPYGAHPDPADNKSAAIEELVQKAQAIHKPQGATLLFCDFLSVSQRPFKVGQKDRTLKEEEDFAKALREFPQIYLQADAVIHLDTQCEQIANDAQPYTTRLQQLENTKMITINGKVHIIAVDVECGSTRVAPFDVVDRIGDREIKSLEDVALARAESAAKRPTGSPGWFQCCNSSCYEDTTPVQMRRMPFGIYSALTADQKGWVFLERFASMVKGAMAHEDQEEHVVFATSKRLADELREGSQMLRKGAEKGKQELKDVLQHFVGELQRKQFSAVSVDKATNTGGMGGAVASGTPPPEDGGFRNVRTTQRPSDRDMVASLMADLVDHLSQNWDATQKAQRQRQLLLAVTRGDVKSTRQLLSVGVDPNMPDLHGMTCVHVAAKCRELEVAKVLIEHKGSLTQPDNEQNYPVHRIGLYSNETTVDLFKLLAPSQAILEAKNKARVTPIQRFAAWAATAVNSEPYEPAANWVAELQRTYPSLKLSDAGGGGMCKNLRSEPFVESTVEVDCGSLGKKNIIVWEPQNQKIERHIVVMCLDAFSPWRFSRIGYEKVARYICSSNQTKMWILNEEIFCPDTTDINVLNKEVVQVIEALPFTDKFTYIVNSCFGGFTALWELKHRISAGVMINPSTWLSDDFIASPAFQGICKVTDGHLQLYRDRNYDKAAGAIGNFAYALSSKDLSSLKVVYRKSLEEATPAFWRSMERVNVRFMTPMYKTLPPLPDLPVLILCSSFAPALLCQETCARFCKLIKNSAIGYIPESKQWWTTEGDVQPMHVANFICELLRKTGSGGAANLVVADMVDDIMSRS